MSGAWQAMLLVGISIAAGAVVVNLLYLLRMLLDAIVAGEVEQPHMRPEVRSLKVWTGTDWFTATVMPVAFGRWGVAVCRDDAPRRAAVLELIVRVRTEPEARGRALLLVQDVLNGAAMLETRVLVRAR